MVLVFGSIGAVAYADFIATGVSLGYLYILPLGISAMFLRSQISYGLIAACVFLHDLFGVPYPSLLARITHNLTALAGFTFVVYVIQRYVKQRELLDNAVRKQRDQLLQDVELAAQVQRMFLPIRRPSTSFFGRNFDVGRTPPSAPDPLVRPVVILKVTCWKSSKP